MTNPDIIALIEKQIERLFLKRTKTAFLFT